MPNFLIIGAEKSGTTALYYFLKQHPQVYMSPVKEPNFFSVEGEKPDSRLIRYLPGPKHLPTDHITDIHTYRRLFQKASSETAIGEVSPVYIYYPKAVGRIQHYMPDTKIIAILRDPVERAYSNFLHCVALGREPLADFAKALEEEEIRVQNNWPALWHYKRKGFYYQQLKRYFDAFEQNQIRVYLYEDLKTDPSGLVRDLFLFLGVDDSFVPDTSVRRNVSGVPKSEALNRVFLHLNRPLIKKYLPPRLLEAWREPIRRRILTQPPRLPGEERRHLIEVFREDVLGLQGLINRDLSRWLEE